MGSLVAQSLSRLTWSVSGQASDWEEGRCYQGRPPVCRGRPASRQAREQGKTLLPGLLMSAVTHWFTDDQHYSLSFIRIRRSHKPGTRLQSLSIAALSRVSADKLHQGHRPLPVVCSEEGNWFVPCVAGMLSHQLKQHVIDGEKTVIQNPTDQQKWVGSVSLVLTLWSTLRQCKISTPCFCRKDHEEVEFEVHEVYAVDVLISTGEGKVRGDLTQGLKTNIWRKYITVSCYHFDCLGQGWRSEDHHLQKRPQQGVRPQDEDIPGIPQRDGKALRHDAFHPEVQPLFSPLDNQRETLSMPHIAACRRVNVSERPRDSTGCVWIPGQLDFLSAVRSAVHQMPPVGFAEQHVTVQLGWTAETPGWQGPTLRTKKSCLMQPVIFLIFDHKHNKVVMLPSRGSV